MYQIHLIKLLNLSFIFIWFELVDLSRWETYIGAQNRLHPKEAEIVGDRKIPLLNDWFKKKSTESPTKTILGKDS